MIEVRDLSKSYGAARVLRGINLTIESGSVVGLFGDNGAGKSTLMKCISGAIKPNSGLIALGGKLIQLGSPLASRAAGIEMVYQDLSLCRQQSVAANIFLGREIVYKLLGAIPVLDRNAMHRESLNVLEQVGISLPPYRTIGELSGGERQAVAIARAVYSAPKFLILDEPTAALAVREVIKVLEIIRGLKSKGVTVVIISHRLHDVFEVSDRILLLEHGKIALDCAKSATSISEISKRLAGVAGEAY